MVWRNHSQNYTAILRIAKSAALAASNGQLAQHGVQAAEFQYRPLVTAVLGVSDGTKLIAAIVNQDQMHATSGVLNTRLATAISH